MDGLFIFDLQNDVIFTKSNDKMESKLVQMCKEQELMDESVSLLIYHIETRSRINFSSIHCRTHQLVSIQILFFNYSVP